ncbi:MAG: terpene cyclase/mutase family protein [Phycisphaerae bacterium]|nr:terpene cyclase/mutase family protein [Phycisphaerae bacterium]
MKSMAGLFCVAAAVSVAAAQGAKSDSTESQPATKGQTVRTETDRRSEELARRITERGAKYLLAAQEKNGGWASETGPGISCLVLKALIRTPSVGPDHPAVKRGIECVLKSQRADGGIYAAEGLYKNYESAVALSMFAVLNKPEYQDRITALRKFLKGLQWDEGEGKSLDDPWYGGSGYGRHQRPDITNTHTMLDALRDSGLSSDDPAYKKALVFVQRCQMLGETNPQPFAAGSTQGGFIYTPANMGESKAGYQQIAGRSELRCFGTVTYAGFKSLLYAGLKRDDPRVRAAFEWIRRYWTLKYNPNMPERQTQEGLYFYYHVFARALRAWGEDVIEDQRGVKHNWRQELIQQLASLQKEDGSWVNEADRYMEGIPTLTTAFAQLAIQEAYPALATPSNKK